MHYVVGFLFNPRLTQVVLIRKQRPDWQKGRLNGVGGKVEAGEKGREAMAREFQEETGLATLPENWLPVARMTNGGEGEYFVVDVFTAWHVDYHRVQTTTEERISIFDFWTAVGLEDTIPNLEWLIPLCRHAMKYADPGPWRRLNMPGCLD